MKLGTELPAGILTPSTVPSNKNEITTSFADTLSAQNVVAKNTASRDEVLAKQPAKKDSLPKEDIEFIREHGMQAYVDKIRAEKIEELREELLRNMGLTEEMLSSMSPDQRAAIEQLISQEIEQRMAANTIMNDGKNASDEESALNSSIEKRWNNTSSHIDAQLEAIVPGAMAGEIMEDVIEASQPLYDDKPEKKFG